MFRVVLGVLEICVGLSYLVSKLCGWALGGFFLFLVWFRGAMWIHPVYPFSFDRFKYLFLTLGAGPWGLRLRLGELWFLLLGEGEGGLSRISVHEDFPCRWARQGDWASMVLAQVCWVVLLFG